MLDDVLGKGLGTMLGTVLGTMLGILLGLLLSGNDGPTLGKILGVAVLGVVVSVLVVLGLLVKDVMLKISDWNQKVGLFVGEEVDGLSEGLLVVTELVGVDDTMVCGDWLVVYNPIVGVGVMMARGDWLGSLD